MREFGVAPYGRTLKITRPSPQTLVHAGGWFPGLKNPGSAVVAECFVTREL
jgi:hypothetical protein